MNVASNKKKVYKKVNIISNDMSEEWVSVVWVMREKGRKSEGLSENNKTEMMYAIKYNHFRENVSLTHSQKIYILFEI